LPPEKKKEEKSRSIDGQEHSDQPIQWREGKERKGERREGGNARLINASLGPGLYLHGLGRKKGKKRGGTV